MNGNVRFCAALWMSATLIGSVIAEAGEDSASIIQMNALSAWQESPGDWFSAPSASADPDNPKSLIADGAPDGGSVLINGQKGRTVNIHSKSHHGDVIIHVEFMVPSGSNSGVYLQSRYEIQILDSFGKPDSKMGFGDCGGIYRRWKNGMGFEGTAPSTNASRPPGTWQTFDAIFRAPTFDDQGKKLTNARFEKVIHNGVLIHENIECTGPTRASTYQDEKPVGPLMLQGDHGPVAYRNIWMAPLN